MDISRNNVRGQNKIYLKITNGALAKMYALLNYTYFDTKNSSGTFHFPKIHRTVLRKTTIDLLYF